MNCNSQAVRRNQRTHTEILRLYLRSSGSVRSGSRRGPAIPSARRGQQIQASTNVVNVRRPTGVAARFNSTISELHNNTPTAIGKRTLRRVLRRANVDATVALNPALGRSGDVKVHCAGTAGSGCETPSPYCWPGVPVRQATTASAMGLLPLPPPPRRARSPRPNRRLNQSPRSWGSLTSCSNASRGCGWRRPLGFRKRKPVANAGAWLLARRQWAGKPLVLNSPPQMEGKVTGCGWGNWGVLVRPCLCWGVRLDQRLGPLNLSTGTIEIFRGTVERK